LPYNAREPEEIAEQVVRIITRRKKGKEFLKRIANRFFWSSDAEKGYINSPNKWKEGQP
jgi:hypothetical protein